MSISIGTVIWKENDLQTTGEGAMTIRYAIVGELIDGRPNLKRIYNPASAADAEKMRRLCSSDSLV
jgi:hypothetical protein